MSHISTGQKFRIRLAIILFVFAIIFDILEIKPLGIDMQQIYRVISENCFAK